MTTDRKKGTSSPKKSKSKSKTDRKRSAATRSARRSVLGAIRKPRKNSTKEEKSFFRNFLKRLEERDLILEESDELAPSDEPGEVLFNQAIGTAEEEWEVEEVLDSSIIQRELHFMVLWKGHLLESCTWETEASLDNSKDAIDDFYAAFPKKTPKDWKSIVKSKARG